MVKRMRSLPKVCKVCSDEIRYPRCCTFVVREEAVSRAVFQVWWGGVVGVSCVRVREKQQGMRDVKCE